jgi:hypothetical protein
MSRGKRFESARRLFILPIDKPNTRKARSFCDLTEAYLHHLYITEAWAILIHKLLPRNALHNAWETIVL